MMPWRLGITPRPLAWPCSPPPSVSLAVHSSVIRQACQYALLPARRAEGRLPLGSLARVGLTLDILAAGSATQIFLQESYYREPISESRLFVLSRKQRFLRVSTFRIYMCREHL